MNYEDTLLIKELNMNINNFNNIENYIPENEYILYPYERKDKIEKGLYGRENFYYKSINYDNYIKNINDIQIENFDKIENIKNKNLE